MQEWRGGWGRGGKGREEQARGQRGEEEGCVRVLLRLLLLLLCASFSVAPPARLPSRLEVCARRRRAAVSTAVPFWFDGAHAASRHTAHFKAAPAPNPRATGKQARTLWARPASASQRGACLPAAQGFSGQPSIPNQRQQRGTPRAAVCVQPATRDSGAPRPAAPDCQGSPPLGPSAAQSK